MRSTTAGVNIPRHRKVDGQTAIISCAGPMSRTVDDCTLILKTWWSDTLYHADPMMAPLPFNDTLYNSTKKLRIGYYTHDGYFTTAQPIVRAINECVELLRADGHTVIEFQPKNMRQLMLNYGALFAGDGGDDFFGTLQGEAPNTRYSIQVLDASLPAFMKPVIRQLLRLAGQARLADLAESAQKRTVHDYWQVQAQTIELRQEFMQQVQELQLDCWLNPVTALPATIQKTSGDVIPAMSTLQQNLLCVPGGSVPVTVVRKDETDYIDGINDMITTRAKQICANSDGLPIGVQVCALPYLDETALRVMRVIEQKVQFNKNYQPAILDKLQ